MNILILNQQNKKINKNRIKRLAKEILKNLAYPNDVEISILLTNDNFIKGLNKKYLKKDKPTDVLSFPMFTLQTPNSKLQTPNLLGDIVISIDTAEKQAALQKTSLNDEIARLLIHGVLHLLGFEHEKGGKKALEMRREERRLIDLLKV
ncbi:MAG: rRNA maturation RNase YbeY [Deltaproteobacteria bacterium]|nr:rRNA maturation RNase YbeY [Deltaproteobacteria bacterium]